MTVVSACLHDDDDNDDDDDGDGAGGGGGVCSERVTFTASTTCSSGLRSLNSRPTDSKSSHSTYIYDHTCTLISINNKWSKGRIAAAHGRFIRVHQVAPMCTTLII